MTDEIKLLSIENDGEVTFATVEFSKSVEPPFEYDFKEPNDDWTEVFYYRTIRVGGKDEDGFYELVQDGPAQGEKAYAK